MRVWFTQALSLVLISGISLVVKLVLPKHRTRVRFSHSAPNLVPGFSGRIIFPKMGRVESLLKKQTALYF